MRQRKLREGISDLLRPRGIHRICGDWKRKPHDDHAAQPLAWDVDPLPEARRAEQERPLGLLKSLEQAAPLAVDALAEDQHFIEIDPLLEGRVHVAQLAVRSEQRKRSASDATRHRRDQLLDGQVKPLVLWQRKICGQTHQSLVIEVEGRGQDQLLDLGTEADARSEEVKSSADRKRRGREHRGTPLRIDPRPQQRADIDWSRAQQQVLSP